ncbi:MULTISPECIES: fimbrial protein [unclassified Serratia (in: enterobacteria)]|uniref:fimbrial protein n=1 Tax=unclassified Serratia (in: enterobacteria) TaxID=2647522 RepID=UPI00050253B7|nr:MULTISPECIES: fimbrial protein [unclassified Serratia (in: enterobacteria)]KFK96798.1 hypothetical protein JV45_03490 [Serratia sp. Ag2]KFK97341.1 hypothetical protein IV04_15860 [Serratia sp. Ag1]
MHKDYGRVNMNGVIINPACSISSDNAEQTIDLGLITQETLNNTAAVTYPFTINLINCVFLHAEENKEMQSTLGLRFDGPSEPGSSWFNLGESSKGLAFQILDGQSNVVIPGAVMRVHKHDGENKKLNYSLRLIKKIPQVKSGRFHSMVYFTLIHQ